VPDEPQKSIFDDGRSEFYNARDKSAPGRYELAAD
jgi:hypothetical protein